MNPVYNPAQPGVPYANQKGIAYPAGFPVGYAPAYTPGLYPGANPAFHPGYAAPFKMSPSTGAVPPYSTAHNPYHAAVYPMRNTYPQQNPYAQALMPSQQQGAYYTQPFYAPQPHVIHHTTVVQPNGMPATMYAPQIPQPRHNGGVAMGMMAGTTMAMSAGTLMTTHSPAGVQPHQVTYRPPGTPTYSYVPQQW
ncbi:unnamed protein product [Boreogadus saida]